MTTVAQKAVPIHAARLAAQGDARALLAIPDARSDIPRLIEGRPRTRYASGNPATEYGSRKAIAAAKQLVTDRQRRREDRQAAEAARQGKPGRFAAMLAEKQAVLASKRAAVAAKRKAKAIEATKEAFRPYYHRAGLRTGGQEHTWTIKIGDPSIRSETTEGWIDYKRQGWRRGIKEHDIIVTIPLHWAARVGDRQLGTVDDLLTLDAEPVPSPVDGIELYRAVWARQGRGLLVATERGFIARTQPGGIAVAVSLSPHSSLLPTGYRTTRTPPRAPSPASSVNCGESGHEPPGAAGRG